MRTDGKRHQRKIGQSAYYDPGQTQSPIQVELKIGKKKQALTADFITKLAFMQELPSNTL